jgi:hypothetical protein
MIIDNDPPITRYISVPREMDQLSCSSLTAGIVEAVLDGLGFVSLIIASYTSFLVTLTLVLRFCSPLASQHIRPRLIHFLRELRF